VPCINSYAVDVWLNNPAVRRALNVPLSLPQWSICSGEVGDSYGRVWTDVSPCYQTLFASGVRALIYNGDTDMACNTIGDEAFARDLNRKILNDRQPWYDQGQVGGFVTEYEGLTFTSVLRSGHMVPQEYIGRPAQAFKLFDTWINKKKW
jgi:cathepsin A (carboxypeptidase C)